MKIDKHGFWRHRPDGFTVNEKEIYIRGLEFKRMTDTGQKYVSETQKLAKIEHLAITCKDLRNCSKTHNGQLSSCAS